MPDNIIQFTTKGRATPLHFSPELADRMVDLADELEEEDEAAARALRALSALQSLGVVPLIADRLEAIADTAVDRILGYVFSGDEEDTKCTRPPRAPGERPEWLRKFFRD